VFDIFKTTIRTIKQINMNFYQLTTQETIQKLGTNLESGLTSTEALQKLDEYGPNELVERGKKSIWRILLDQFKEIMIVVLIVAAIISAILGEYLDVAVIMAIVILNAVLGFSQEYRAEQAMAALKKMAVPKVRVRRDGKISEVLSTRLVPGDIILLESGNLVPADCRVVDTKNLKVQESALTGESEPVEKNSAAIAGKYETLGDRFNMLYMGTIVTYGRASAVVTATGMQTELGNIADLIQGVGDDMTPLQKRLAQLGKTLAFVALIIIAIVVVTGLFRGDDLEELFLTGVSLAVAAIPESLPAVVTITLALGSQRLLKRNALIRKLPAVETLGSVTVICSDKTGTLTENRMTVTILDVAGNTEDLQTLLDRRGRLVRARLIADDADPHLSALSVLVRAGALCNDAVLETDSNGVVRALGDPTEGALLLAAKALGFDKEELEGEWPRVDEVPFTSERKRMTTVHKMSPVVKQTDLPWRDAPYIMLTKGAVDSLLDICERVLVENKFVPLDEVLLNRIRGANEDFAKQGQRVLGISIRICDCPDLPEENEMVEKDGIFVGMVAMMDPPRPEVKRAVTTAKNAGIRPVMITGDHPLTAVQIAKDLGITENEKYLSGAELNAMTPAELAEVVEDVSVYARVAPEHKLNIVEALQDNGEIAAMTGDGVNDAPALKQADIGVAMGITGTDVSKEAADMVLLDDNFTTIVSAVEAGRTIFDNIRKFIKYTLSSNTGELFLMLVGPFFGMPLPLLPLQILWINLVTDGLPGLALAEEEGERGIMNRSPFSLKENIFSRGLGTQIIWIGILMGLISLGVGYVYWSQDPNGPWQTMIFTTLVFAQMGNAVATRSFVDSLHKIGVFRNRLMVGAVFLGFALQVGLIYVPFLQRVFKTEPLTAQELLICVAASLILFLAVEGSKVIKRMRGGAVFA
jgi:Ca2+-transporting ATPase